MVILLYVVGILRFVDAAFGRLRFNLSLVDFFSNLGQFAQYNSLLLLLREYSILRFFLNFQHNFAWFIFDLQRHLEVLVRRQVHVVQLGVEHQQLYKIQDA